MAIAYIKRIRPGYAASPDKNQLTPETSSNIQHTEQDPLLSDKNVPIDGKPKKCA